jgi:hypothetical protein
LIIKDRKMSKTVEEYLDEINKARIKGEDISQRVRKKKVAPR